MLGFIDCETRSTINLRTAGTPKYATAGEVLLVSWAIDYGPAKVWDATDGSRVPEDLLWMLEECDELWAHNAFFDRTLLAGEPLHLERLVPLHKWRCAMALALSHGLPGGLDKLGEIFKIDADKRKLDGKDFIKLFCVAKKDGSFNDRRSHPAEWKEFKEYARMDIPAMQEIHRHCPKVNYGSALESAQREVALWHLDQRINDRGFAVDREFARHAVRATEKEKRRLADRTAEITEGGVLRATQRDKLLTYLLEEHGVSLPDLRADTVERRLEDPELPEFVKELLRIRLQATKASTSKYKRLLQMEVAGRLCGTLQFAAANRTGRWGGRGFQPQNQPRPTHKYDQILMAIQAMKDEAEDILLMSDDPADSIMAYASSAIRSAIVAACGKKLVVSDLSNIEGRTLVWLAEEEWKLEAFRDYDTFLLDEHGQKIPGKKKSEFKRKGFDLYILAYARAFNVDPETVDSFMRQIGKVMELALGYGGGVGAFVTMAATYGIDLDELAERAWDTIPVWARTKAQQTWAWAKQQRRTLGLDEKVYVVCEALKILWREAHPNVVSMWGAVEYAAKAAILNPGKKFEAARCTFVRKKEWLYVKLPSGRFLCYPQPRVENDTISYMGVNVYSKRWHRITTYGGKFVENIDQAVSRDVIANAMPRAEATGYPLVLTVHDELVAETPDSSEFNVEGLSAILATNPPWSQGLPLAAAGFESYRYRKGD